VEGYRNILFYHTKLFAYIDEESLWSLNNFQIETLIDSMHLEINELFGRVFGSGTGDDRGEFSVHIGYAPEINSDNQGSGESGRLLSEFYFWMSKERQGIAAVAAAPWDKPLWDSRDSAIKAPTIRSSVNIAVSTAVIVVGAVVAVPSPLWMFPGVTKAGKRRECNSGKRWSPILLMPLRARFLEA
jgi:hypothetical protein